MLRAVRSTIPGIDSDSSPSGTIGPSVRVAVPITGLERPVSSVHRPSPVRHEGDEPAGSARRRHESMRAAIPSQDLDRDLGRAKKTTPVRAIDGVGRASIRGSCQACRVTAARSVGRPNSDVLPGVDMRGAMCGQRGAGRRRAAMSGCGFKRARSTRGGAVHLPPAGNSVCHRQAGPDRTRRCRRCRLEP